MLTSQFLPEVFGGAEQQCLRLAKALRALGHAPQILTSRSDPATPGEETLAGIPVTRILTPAPPQIGGRSLASTLLWARRVKAWARAHRAEIDLVHCHQAKLNAWIGVRLARALGVPSLVKPGSAGPNFDLARLAKKRFLYGHLASREIAARADRMVAISAEMAADLTAFGVSAGRMTAIPNGVALPGSATPDVRQAQRAALGVAEDTPLLLFVGRMEPQKNVETLLRAVAGRAVHLVLLGDGALLEAHRAEAADLGLGARVQFLGRVSDVRPYLAAADLFVLPARAEGMSNALLEAMAAGRPAVASAVAGTTDLIADGVSGFLYGPPEDAVALGAAIDRALAAPTERIGRAARATIREGYTMEQIAARYVRLYEDLLTAQVSR